MMKTITFVDGGEIDGIADEDIEPLDDPEDLERLGL